MVAAAASMGRQLELAGAVLHMQLVADHLPSASAAQRSTAAPASAAAALCHMLVPAPAQQCAMSQLLTAHIPVLVTTEKKQDGRQTPDSCESL